MNAIVRNLSHELKAHAPFTILGTVLGIGFMALLVYTSIPRSTSEVFFEIAHPAHVFMSAIATTAMYRRYAKRPSWLAVFLIGFVGSIGIGTLSDCLIPFLGESLLKLPHAHAHIGFIEEWYLVNPLAVLGILAALVFPNTKVPHSGHVLLSIFASLFHMSMALGDELTMPTMILTPVFLFLAVWIPCCTSDIAFPLLFVKNGPVPHACGACEPEAPEAQKTTD